MIDGGLLQAKRRSLGLTQMQLAVLAGVSLSTLAKLEQGGGKQTTLKVVALIAAALGMPASDLLISDHDVGDAQGCADDQEPAA